MTYRDLSQCAPGWKRTHRRCGERFEACSLRRSATKLDAKVADQIEHSLVSGSVEQGYKFSEKVIHTVFTPSLLLAFSIFHPSLLPKIM